MFDNRVEPHTAVTCVGMSSLLKIEEKTTFFSPMEKLLHVFSTRNTLVKDTKSESVQLGLIPSAFLLGSLSVWVLTCLYLNTFPTAVEGDLHCPHIPFW